MKSNNPFDAPLIDPAYYTSPVDLAIARESIRALFRFMAAPAWKDVLIGPTAPLVNDPSDEFLDAFLRNVTGSDAHPTGTAAMSPADASWGVVNPNLLMKNANGLRIIDASIYVSYVNFLKIIVKGLSNVRSPLFPARTRRRACTLLRSALRTS